MFKQAEIVTLSVKYIKVFLSIPYFGMCSSFGNFFKVLDRIQAVKEKKTFESIIASFHLHHSIKIMIENDVSVKITMLSSLL